MDDRINIAAVCGNEVRIYGLAQHGNRPRPLLKVLHFPHRGAALLFAQEYEQDQRNNQNRWW